MTSDQQISRCPGATAGPGRPARRSRWIPPAVAVALTLPSIWAGWQLDDHFHRARMLRPEGLATSSESPWDLFVFLDGNTERTQRLMDLGFAPWWTLKTAKAAFWRPIATLTHWLDYRLWPAHPTLMHAHSLLWFAALVTAVAMLYRRFDGATWPAALAALLYAVDDARAMPAGWLANRNALLAGLFGVLAIAAHDHWRRRGGRAASVAAPLLLGASLLSAEAGIATCAYLFSHVMFIDGGPRRRRLATLLPYVGVVVLWRATWTYLGCGIEGIGLYVDPLAEPVSYAAAVLQRAPLLLLGQWALPPSEAAIVLGSTGMRWLQVAGWACGAVLLVLFVPLLRKDRVGRFWAAGMLLSLLPLCATFPADRLLLFVGIGAMGLLARFLCVVAGRSEVRPKRRAWRIGATVTAVGFVGVHLVIAPAALCLRAAYPMGPKPPTQPLCVHAGLDETAGGQDVILVNPPSTFHAIYFPMIRILDHPPAPRHTRILAPSLFRPVTVRRTDARTLVVRPADGYFAREFERLFRNRKHPMTLGQLVKLTGVTVEVTALTEDARPAEATFRFRAALEDPSLRWLQWKEGHFVPFRPPPVGTSTVLPSRMAPAEKATASE